MDDFAMSCAFEVFRGIRQPGMGERDANYFCFFFRQEVETQ